MGIFKWWFYLFSHVSCYTKDFYSLKICDILFRINFCFILRRYYWRWIFQKCINISVANSRFSTSLWLNHTLCSGCEIRLHLFLSCWWRFLWEEVTHSLVIHKVSSISVNNFLVTTQLIHVLKRWACLFIWTMLNWSSAIVISRFWVMVLFDVHGSLRILICSMGPIVVRKFGLLAEVIWNLHGFSSCVILTHVYCGIDVRTLFHWDILSHAGIIRLLQIWENLTCWILYRNINVIWSISLLHALVLLVVHLQLVSYTVCASSISSCPGYLTSLWPLCNLDLIYVTEECWFFDPTLILVFSLLILRVCQFKLLGILLNLLNKRFDFEVYSLLVRRENDSIRSLPINIQCQLLCFMRAFCNLGCLFHEALEGTK